MKKEILITLTTVALIFSACGNNRGGDCDEMGGNLGSKVEYKNPTAIIDVNSTTHQYVPALKEYTIDRTHLENPFIFKGDRSQDNDENNQSITKYSWDIKHTFSTNCVDLNISGSTAIFRFDNTDTNETCANEAIDNGEINVSLTVTDDEGKTDTTIKTIGTN